MLSYRLVDCEDCTSVSSLINDIDCKVTDISKSLYNNIVYGLRNYTRSDIIWDLLQYKRILQYKKCNPEYANKYNVGNIAGKVKLLIFK